MSKKISELDECNSATSNDYIPVVQDDSTKKMSIGKLISSLLNNIYATINHTHTKSEIGLGNVDNVKQYSEDNPPPYPVTSVNGKTGTVSVEIPVTDVQVDGTTIIENGVANIPIGSTSNLGVFGISNNYGITVTASGKLYLRVPSEADIDARLNYKAIMPSNMDYAVKTAMSDGVGTEWTDDEKSGARTRMNAQETLVSGTNIKTINNESILGSGDITIQGGSGTQMCFAITEDMVTVEQDATKGVAPYSTSYGYTNITIDEDAGISWVEGAIYNFVVNTEMVVNSSYRNVRVRIGESGDWKPCMGTTAIVAGSTYFVKAYNTTWQYKSVYQTNGALHLQTDNNTNTTYSYLVNTVTTASTIDEDGFGAKNSLIWATTPLSDTAERWSSFVASCSTATTKTVLSDLTFYADRHSQYISSNDVPAGKASSNSFYQDYTGYDARYSVNTSGTYMSVKQKAFLYLKNFNTSDYSFKADAEIGSIFTLDKIATKFPVDTTGDVYIYFLGWTGTSSYYAVTPNFTQENRIYKYTPSTGAMELFKPSSGGGSANITSGTTDLEDGVSTLSTGTLYCVYEE